MRQLAHHFVSLAWNEMNPQTEQAMRHEAASGFVISVRDNWLLITAGHVLGHIKRARELKWRVDDIVLDDGWSLSQRLKEPVPFDYFNATSIIFGEDDIDYGVVHIQGHFRRSLEVNGIQPIEERHWKPEWPEAFDWYALMGLPSEHAVRSETGVSRALVTLPVRPLADPPESLKKEHPRWYGEVQLDENPELRMTSLKGISGGPLFGFTERGGTLRYWIVGVQSGCDKATRRKIAACFVEPLICAIDRSLSQSQP